MDHLIDLVAANQLGLITRQQLVTIGMTQRMIDYRVRNGRLSTIHRGVYRVCGSPASFDQLLLAALLAVGAGAKEILGPTDDGLVGVRGAVSHKAAAAVLGLTEMETEVVEITVPHDRRIRLAGVVVHRTRNLDARDVCWRGPLVLTSPARTLVDLADVLAFPALDRAVSNALRKGLASLADLRATFERRGARKRRGIRGIGDIRVLIRLRERQALV